MRPIYHSNCERSPFYLLFIFSVCINIVLVMRVKYWRKKTGISNFSGENRNEVDSSALVLSIELHQNQYRRIYPWRIIQMSSNILFHYHFRIFNSEAKYSFRFQQTIPGYPRLNRPVSCSTVTRCHINLFDC